MRNCVAGRLFESRKVKFGFYFMEFDYDFSQRDVDELAAKANGKLFKNIFAVILNFKSKLDPSEGLLHTIILN